MAAAAREMRGGGLARGGARGRAGCGRGEAAGLHEQEKLFEVADNTGEHGGDEGVQGRRQEGAILQSPLAGEQPGDQSAEGGLN